MLSNVASNLRSRKTLKPTVMIPITLLFILCLNTLVSQANCQDGIIELTVKISPTKLEKGSTGEIRVIVRNTGAYEAEKINVSISMDPDEGKGIKLKRCHGEIGRLPPYGEKELTFPFKVAEEAGSKRYLLKVEAKYMYCTETMCFFPTASVKKEITLGEEVEEGVFTIPLENIFFILSAFSLGFFSAALFSLFRKRGRTALACLFLTSISLITMALYSKQHVMAKSVSENLCLSCVGLDTSEELEKIEISPETEAEIRKIEGKITLIVFKSKFCHACPYAEKWVKAFSDKSGGKISYKVVDVEEEPRLAEKYGVKSNNKYLVPAISVKGRGKTIFGTNNLEKRILELIKSA